ncbi:MAG: hypothetical protein GW949_06055 [Spirochaetales bacterium]|nr:hypothetical protein [Spirochaetales bacterium]
MKRTSLVLLGILLFLSSGVWAQNYRIYDDGNLEYVPRGTEFSLFSEDMESGVQTVYYQVNGGQITEYTGSLSFSQDGRYSISYYSIDRMGNISLPQFRNFVVDGTAPQMTQATRGEAFIRDNSVYVRSNTGLLVLATDLGSGVGNVYVSLDGTNYLRYDYEAFINEAGRHTAYVYAEDRVGNRTGVTQFSLVVDNTPPDVRIVPLQPLEAVQGERFSAPGNSFIIRASDSEAGLKVIEVSVDRQEFFTYNQPIVIAQPGIHSIRARAIDNLGNVSLITDLSFSVDARKPQINSSITDSRFQVPSGQ